MKNTDMRFPNRILIADVALLSTLCLAVPVAMKAASHPRSGANDVGLFFQVLYRLIEVCFWTGLVFFYQRVVYRWLKTRIESRVMWATLFLWPTVLIGSWSLYGSTPRARAQRILAHAGLAPLPESATDIKLFTWSTPFSGEEFLRFRISSDDLEPFLQASPILRSAECKEYSKGRMRLAKSDEVRRPKECDEDPNEYFRPTANAPPWYTQEIKGPGKRYGIRPKGYHSVCEVIIDEQNNLIFVMLVFS